jgi:hypothetical protein
MFSTSNHQFRLLNVFFPPTYSPDYAQFIKENQYSAPASSRYTSIIYDLALLMLIHVLFISVSELFLNPMKQQDSLS